jgi:hypothetical protein
LKAPAFVALATTALTVAAAGACTLPAEGGFSRAAAGAAELAWRVEGALPIAVGRAFAVEVRTCPYSAMLVEVDATMPEHRHGMNYRAKLLPVAPGQWRVEGLVWHMPGRWQWRFELELDGRRVQARPSIVLP